MRTHRHVCKIVDMSWYECSRCYSEVISKSGSTFVTHVLNNDLYVNSTDAHIHSYTRTFNWNSNWIGKWSVPASMKKKHINVWPMCHKSHSMHSIDSTSFKDDHRWGIKTDWYHVWWGRWYRDCCVEWDHDDVINWKHFPRYLPFVRGIQFPLQRPVIETLMIWDAITLIMTSS